MSVVEDCANCSAVSNERLANISRARRRRLFCAALCPHSTGPASCELNDGGADLVDDTLSAPIELH